MTAGHLGLAGLSLLLAASVVVPAAGQEASEPPAVQAEPTPPAASTPAEPPAPAAPAVEAPAAAAPSTPQEAGQTDAATPPAVPDLQADAVASLETLSPLVGDVQIVGPWTDGERRGIWRTVMLQSLGETVGNRFFVQQIEEVDGAVAVSSSTEITEVAEIDGAVVGYRVDEPSAERPEQLTLFLDIVPLDGEISETYELFFTAGDPYIFGPASN